MILMKRGVKFRVYSLCGYETLNLENGAQIHIYLFGEKRLESNKVLERNVKEMRSKRNYGEEWDKEQPLGSPTPNQLQKEAQARLTAALKQARTRALPSPRC